MPQGENRITRQQVLAAIKQAGPAGVTRKALIERFDCSESNIDNHVMWLNREKPPVIVKLRLGLVAAAEFAAAAPQKTGEPARGPLANRAETSGSPVAADAARLAAADSAARHPEAAPARGASLPPVDIHGVSLDVDHHEAADLSAAERAQQMAQIAPARYAVAFASDFYDSIEAAVAMAERSYDSDSLKHAVVIACSPVGAIDLRHVFVPAVS